eukprot:163466-Pelagomonas_calceolata.AAC.6
MLTSQHAHGVNQGCPLPPHSYSNTSTAKPGFIIDLSCLLALALMPAPLKILQDLAMRSTHYGAALGSFSLFPLSGEGAQVL